MRLTNLARFGAAVLVGLALTACDGTENPRTQPTGEAGLITPALIGPEVEGHSEGEEGYREGDPEAEGEGEGNDTVNTEGEGESEGEGEAPAEAEPTSEGY